MCRMPVIVVLEIEELRLQIRGRPEQGAVQTFAPNGANQAFHIDVTEDATFDGVTIPRSGRAGWFSGTDRGAAAAIRARRWP